MTCHLLWFIQENHWPLLSSRQEKPCRSWDSSVLFNNWPGTQCALHWIQPTLIFSALAKLYRVTLQFFWIRYLASAVLSGVMMCAWPGHGALSNSYTLSNFCRLSHMVFILQSVFADLSPSAAKNVITLHISDSTWTSILNLWRVYLYLLHISSTAHEVQCTRGKETTCDLKACCRKKIFWKLPSWKYL
jgi:hypothetical protein